MRDQLCVVVLSCAIGCAMPGARPSSASPAAPEASEGAGRDAAAALAPARSAGEAPAPPPLSERVFQRQVEGKAFTVTVRATALVAPALLDLLEEQLRVLPVGEGRSAAELAFWRARPMVLRPDRPEVQIELRPASSSVDAAGYLWTWPDAFRISRPGVLELRPQYEKVRPQRRGPGAPGVALPVDPDSLHGRVTCQGEPLPFVQVAAAGHGSRTGADGRFTISGPFPTAPTTVFVAYDGNVALSTSVSVRLQIIDDFHVTRSDHVDKTPTVVAEVAEYGDLAVGGTDCRLWQWGHAALDHYWAQLGALPPDGELRVKRWSAVFEAAGAGAHAFYDYLVLPTDFVARRDLRDFFHEFGHSIRHVADGDETHWHWDDTRFIYARVHSGTEVTNKGYTFNEGWAHYWASAGVGSPVLPGPGHPGAAFVDWNEDLVGARLWDLSQGAGASPAFMARVLLNNRGAVHTLYQFEQRYCAALPGGTNAFCAHRAPVRAAPPSCPPGYNDDGATCRLIDIVAKPSSGRGVGLPPTGCGAGKEYDAGLCYPICPAGFDGVGPVCWQICPAGYHDDGATCRRDAHITGANNSACPWYDKCGLTFAKGCSVCPNGYHNDGCTCRRDVSIIGKSSQGRGVGTVPTGCGGGKQLDAGLCYPPCPAAYTGAGPVCWGTCPAGFADHGATCYRPPNIFSDDA